MHCRCNLVISPNTVTLLASLRWYGNHFVKPSATSDLQRDVAVSPSTQRLGKQIAIDRAKSKGTARLKFRRANQASLAAFGTQRRDGSRSLARDLPTSLVQEEARAALMPQVRLMEAAMSSPRSLVVAPPVALDPSTVSASVPLPNSQVTCPHREKGLPEAQDVVFYDVGGTSEAAEASHESPTLPPPEESFSSSGPSAGDRVLRPVSHAAFQKRLHPVLDRLRSEWANVHSPETFFDVAMTMLGDAKAHDDLRPLAATAVILSASTFLASASSAESATVVARAVCAALDRIADVAVESSSGAATGTPPPTTSPVEVQLSKASSHLLFVWWEKRHPADLEMTRRTASVAAFVLGKFLSGGVLATVPAAAVEHLSSNAVLLDGPRHTHPAADAVRLYRRTAVRLASAGLGLLRNLHADGQSMAAPIHPTVLALMQAVEDMAWLDADRCRGRLVASGGGGGRTCTIAAIPAAPSKKAIDGAMIPKRTILDLVYQELPRTLVALPSLITAAVHHARHQRQVSDRSMTTGNMEPGDTAARPAFDATPLLSPTLLGSACRVVHRHWDLTNGAAGSGSHVPAEDAGVCRLAGALFETRCRWPGTRTFLRLIPVWMTASIPDSKGDDRRRLHTLKAPALARTVVALAAAGVQVDATFLQLVLDHVNQLVLRGEVDEQRERTLRSALHLLRHSRRNADWAARMRKTTADRASPTQEAQAALPPAAVQGPHSTPGSAFALVRMTRNDPFVSWGFIVEDGSMAVRLQSGNRTPASRAFSAAADPHTPLEAESGLDPARCRLLAMDGVPVETPSAARSHLFGALSVALHLEVRPPRTKESAA